MDNPVLDVPRLYRQFGLRALRKRLMKMHVRMIPDEVRRPTTRMLEESSRRKHSPTNEDCIKEGKQHG